MDKNEAAAVMYAYGYPTCPELHGELTSALQIFYLVMPKCTTLFSKKIGKHDGNLKSAIGMYGQRKDAYGIGDDVSRLSKVRLCHEEVLLDGAGAERQHERTVLPCRKRSSNRACKKREQRRD